MVNWSAVTGFEQVPALANTASGGTFWAGMLQMMWVILILIFIGFGFEVAIMIGTFLALLMSFYLVYAELIAWQFIVQFSGILFFMFLYIIWSSNSKR